MFYNFKNKIIITKTLPRQKTKEVFWKKKKKKPSLIGGFFTVISKCKPITVWLNTQHKEKSNYRSNTIEKCKNLQWNNQLNICTTILPSPSFYLLFSPLSVTQSALNDMVLLYTADDKRQDQIVTTDNTKQ